MLRSTRQLRQAGKQRKQQQAAADSAAAVKRGAGTEAAAGAEPKPSGTDIERLRISLGELEARHPSSGSTSSVE